MQVLAGRRYPAATGTGKGIPNKVFAFPRGYLMLVEAENGCLHPLDPVHSPLAQVHVNPEIPLPLFVLPDILF